MGAGVRRCRRPRVTTTASSSPATAAAAAPAIVAVPPGTSTPPGRLTPWATGAVNVPDGLDVPADAVGGGGAASTTVPTLGASAGSANP